MTKTQVLFTEAQNQEIVNLLWDCMKRDADHRDRVRTGWGTKTKEGLCACIERIANGDLPKVSA